MTLKASIARLRAQADLSDEVIFPADMAQQNPALIKRERDLFNQRMAALNTELSVLKESYRLAKEELDILRPLVKEQVVSMIELLKLQREANTIKGEITKVTDAFKNETLAKLNELNAELQVNLEALKRLEDKQKKTV